LARSLIRTNAGYSTGAGNRLENDGTWTYTYDAEGNVIKRSKGVSSDTWEYTYDHNNQLLTMAHHLTDGGTVAQFVTLVYDAWGNRIERLQWISGLGYATQRFMVDGWDPKKAGAVGTENFDVWAILNASNALTARHAHGGRVDEVIARQSSGGANAWYLTDHQGSVRRVVNDSATLLATTGYSAYGEVTGGTVYGGYGYTGREWDAVAGAWHLRARMYLPDIGRFLSEDPKGFAAGDENLYRYVKNSPTNATDPSGMFWFGRKGTGGIESMANKLKSAGIDTRIIDVDHKLVGRPDYRIIYVPTSYRAKVEQLMGAAFVEAMYDPHRQREVYKNLGVSELQDFVWINEPRLLAEIAAIEAENKPAIRSTDVRIAPPPGTEIVKDFLNSESVVPNFFAHHGTYPDSMDSRATDAWKAGTGPKPGSSVPRPPGSNLTNGEVLFFGLNFVPWGNCTSLARQAVRARPDKLLRLPAQERVPVTVLPTKPQQALPKPPAAPGVTPRPQAFSAGQITCAGDIRLAAGGVRYGVSDARVTRKGFSQMLFRAGTLPRKRVN
jgi:RHS repeat-associated protein